MKVFVTGGTGFIGHALINALLKHGDDITALVRKPRSLRAQALQDKGVKIAAGDITRRETMREAMHGADMVIHSAGMYEYGMDRAGKQRIQAINVGGTDNVLGLAYELKIPLTIHVSSIQAFGETGHQLRDETFTRQYPCHTAYEQSKTDSHAVALSYQRRGMPLIIVCPHGTIGPNDQSAFGYFQRMYVNRIMLPMASSPNSVYSLVAVNDLARGIILAVERGRIGETYFFCGEIQSIRQIFSSWTKHTGGFRVRFWLPENLVAITFMPLEPLQRLFGFPAFLSREVVRGNATNWCYSSEKAQRELGWSHCTAAELWSTTIEGEIRLLAKRKSQNLIQRLKPLEIID